MSDAPTFLIGGNGSNQASMTLRMANRHGLIAGATGTGKTVTLQTLAEHFSRNGVPVVLADVKGDLSGLATAGKPHPKIDERLLKIGIKEYVQQGRPVVFWDLYAQQGHPVRTTISEFGPLLLSSVLDLNDAQTGALYSVFKLADDQGLLLLDLKDLSAMLNWLKDEGAELLEDQGGVSAASIAAIQRRLLVLEEQGAEKFFGEPAIDLQDLMRCDFGGQGVVSVLDSTKLIQEPRLYALFLLWLISELFEQLPEVGDADRPKLVFFFDEAHLLFDEAPKVLVDKIEQVVRLIRSKGVGIYFVTQSPSDVPDDVLAQLGNRVQHALRAFTPKEQKAVKVAAETFRPNPAFSTEEVITQLAVGEALVSVLDANGIPTVVERVLIAPPSSRIGPLTAEERASYMARSPLKGRYEQAVDRESAHELLQKKTNERQQQENYDTLLKERAKDMAKEDAARLAREAAEAKSAAREAKASAPAGRPRQSAMDALVKSAARSIGSSVGRQIIRGVLGSLLGKRR